MADRRQSAVENERSVREQDKVMLRLPDGMRDRLKAAALEQKRSMNAEIVSRLDRYPSLGGEVDAMFAVAVALAFEIDKVAGPEFTAQPLLDKIGDAFSAVDMDSGEVDRAKLSREYGEEAAKRLQTSGGNPEEWLPPGLYMRIHRQAANNKRDVREEIVQALEASFPIIDLTFGQHMQRLREVLAGSSDQEGVLRPFFEALLRSYEMFAARNPGWENKRPKHPVQPGGFPTNMETAPDEPQALDRRHSLAAHLVDRINPTLDGTARQEAVNALAAFLINPRPEVADRLALDSPQPTPTVDGQADR